MRELPFLLSSIYILYAGYKGFVQYQDTNFFILIALFFGLVFLTGALITSRPMKKLLLIASKSSALVYPFLISSIFFLFIGVLLFFTLHKTIGPNSVPIRKYAIFPILAISLSNYNIFVYLMKIRNS